jgi:uncharacterized protein with LGFP repeats
MKDQALSTRLVERTSALLGRKGTTRRSFLAKTAVVGSAIAVNPITYLVRPGTAYASFCGDGAGCDSGWTAFCCSVNGGSNSCPPGSFVAGWWKADNAAYCCGASRYIIDCNATVPVQCGCHCASYGCDQRRTCCNQFRYGQCHQEIGAYGPVVCRVATCTPPWQYDASCTTDSATDNRTVDHGSPCLPDNECAPPSAIAQFYAALGGSSSFLGPMTQNEGPTPDGLGRYALYGNGGIWDSPGTGTHEVHGRIFVAYARMGFSPSVLGFPISNEQVARDGTGRFSNFQGGDIYWHPAVDSHAVYGQIGNLYRFFGGPASGLGYPLTDELPVGDGRGRYNNFQFGDIYWSPQTGPIEVTGDIGAVYRFIGGPRSVAGYPVSHVSAGAGGSSYSRFEYGSITKTPGSGAFLVQGEIWRKYQQLGAEGSVVGLPITQELDGGIPYSKMSRFQKGTIYWRPDVGAHEVHGDADMVYRFVGGPRSSLGMPNDDTRAVAGGFANYFTSGGIYSRPGLGTFMLDGDIALVYRFIGGPTSTLGWPTTQISNVGDARKGRYAIFQKGGLWSTKTTGAKGCWGPIFTKYQQLGGPTGSLGYPTSFVDNVTGGQRTTFEHGTLTLNTTTGVVTQS